MADYDVGDIDELLDAVMGDDDDDDDDESGADYDVGATARAARKKRAKVSAARAAFSANAKGKLKKMLKERRALQLSLAGKLPVVFLGFDTTIAASASTPTITSEPNVDVRPTDLIVRSANAEDWQFTAMKIGRVDLLTGSTGVPGGIFATSVQRPPISSPELEGGTLASINGTNLTAASSRFLAAYLCLDISASPVSP